MPRLLRPRDDRPNRCAADQRDEIASSHRLPLKQRILFYHPEGFIVHHGKFRLPMSALGQKRTSQGIG
jgi:hypothetical protein